MRKSFTRLFSIFMLVSMFFVSFASTGAVSSPAFDGTKSTPKHTANNVKPADAAKFIAVFDTEISIAAAGGTFSVYTGGGQLLNTIVIPSASVVVGADGKSLEVTHGMTLTAGEYNLSLTANAVKKADGTGGNDAIAPTAWQFVIGDYVAPTLLGGDKLVPKNGATHVDAQGSSVITLEFDEPIAAGTGNVAVYRADGTVVELIAASAGDYTTTKKVTFTLTTVDGWKDLETYYVEVEAGAIVDNYSEKDTDGSALSPAVINKNKFAGINDNTTFTFSIKDYTAPVVSGQAVTAGDNTATVSATLNEVGKVYWAVYTGTHTAPTTQAEVNTGSGAVAKGSFDAPTAGAVASGPITGLSPDVDYKVYLSATNTYLKGTTGEYTNANGAVVNKTFTTSDADAPGVVGTLGAGNRIIDTDTKETVGILIPYDEEVVPGTGVITIRVATGDLGFLTIDASLLTVKKNTTSGNWEVTVPFSTSLVSDVQYYVVMPQGVVKDKQGNAAPAIDKASGFYITGSDFSVPTVSSVAFENDPMTLTDNIIIKFSEQLTTDGSTVLTNGSSITADGSKIAFETNNTLVAAAITYNIVSSQGQITINPTSALAENTTYSIRIRPGVFKDDNANAIASELSYELTTLDLGAATFAFSADPAVSGGEIKKDAEIKVVFNKMPKVVSGSTTVAATNENLAALVTFQDVTGTATDIPFSLAYGMNTTSGKYEAVITPSANLTSDASISFDMDHTKLKDSQGTTFGDVTALTATVEDWKAPAVTMDRSGQLYNDGNAPAFTISFDEAMYVGATALSDAQDVSDYVTFKLTDASGENVGYTNIRYATATKKITIAATLTEGKTYYYAIGTSLNDAAGNKIAATSSTFTWNADEVVGVTSTSPETAATDVVLTGTGNNELVVTVTFDQISSFVLGKTDAERTVYLMPVGNDDLDGVDNVLGNADDPALASKIIADADLVGSTLTIKFTVGTPADFYPLKKWYVYIPSGIIKSSVTADVLFPGFPLTTVGSGTTWPDLYIVSKDNVKPSVELAAAADTNDDDEVDTPAKVALDYTIPVEFSEKVVKGTGNITIKEGTTVVQTIDVTSASVVLASDGESATIKHDALPKYEQAYTVNIPVTAFKDVAGNELTAAYVGTFTTIDKIAPTIAKYTPAVNADIVPLTDNFVLEFSEDVVAVNSKLIQLYKWDTSLTTPAWALIDDILAQNTAVSGKFVTINPTADLEADTKYAVKIEAGAFTDKDDPTSDYAGIADFTTWYFSTENIQSPVASFSYTTRSDDKVDITSNIVITFNKPIEKVGGGVIENADIASLFVIKNTTATPDIVLTFTGVISDDKKTVTISGASLDPALISLTEYNVGVADGAMRGTTNDGVIGYSANNDDFTVSDYTKPVATINSFGTIAGDKLEGSVKSSEKGTVYYIFQEGDATTATPTAAQLMAGSSVAVEANTNKDVKFESLTDDTSYVLFALSVDEMDNVSDIVKLVQKTKDVSGPVIVDKEVVFDKTGKDLVVEFDEDIALTGTPTATLIDKATGVAVADLAMAVSGKELTLTWSAMPNLYNEYYIEIEKGDIKDTESTPNVFAGLYGTAYEVTTADQTAPTSATLKPTNGSTVDLDQVFTVTFNEDVQLVSPAPVSAVVVKEGSVDYEVVADVTASGKVVTINPSRDFKGSTSYTLTMLANTVADLAGNKYASPVTGTYTAKDVSAVGVTFAPADGAKDQALNLSTATITFGSAVTMKDGSVVDVFDVDSLVAVTTSASKAPKYTLAWDATNKDKVTVTFTADLEPGASYTVAVKEAFKGSDGLVIPAAMATFTTVLTPEAVTILPDNGTSDDTPITVDQVFTITANLPFHTYSTTASQNNLPVTADYAKNTAFTLTEVGVGTVAINATISDDGKTITITPAADLKNPGVEYNLTLVADKMQLGTGNALVLSSAQTVQYVTNDITAPVVDETADTGGFTDGFMPANEGIPAKSTAVKITFDEKVKAGTGNIEFRSQDGVLVKTVDASTVTVDATTEKIVTIAADMTDLVTNKVYYIIIPSGAITDLAGNAYAGLSAIDDWSFTLKDDAAPQATYSPNDVDGVLVTTDLEITFDRPVALGTASDVFIAIYDGNGNAVELIKQAALASKVTLTGGNEVATIDINVLEEATTYEVQIGAGTFVTAAGAVKFDGVPFNTWSFTTEDNTAPEVVTLTPESGTEVDAISSLSIEFDKNVQAGTGSIVLRKAGGDLVEEFDIATATIVDMTVTVNITAELEAGTAYYVIVEAGAITNTTATPEEFAGLLTPLDWTFATGADIAAPTLVTWTPMETTALTDNHPTFVMTFDEDVVLSAAGGNLVVTAKDSTTASLTIDLADAVIDGMTVTVDYDAAVSGGLDKDTEYFVTVDAGALEDMVGNAWEGVADVTTWTFTTGSTIVTDVDELVKTGFKVYPNPFDGYVKVDNGEQLSRIVISNVAGQRVKDIVSPSNNIKTGDLRSGIYFITLVKDDAVVKTERIVKR